MFLGASLVAQSVKNLPAMAETRVRFLDWEDPLEKEMATHSSILAWRIPWTEENGGLQSMGSQRVRHNLVTKQQQIPSGNVEAKQKENNNLITLHNTWDRYTLCIKVYIWASQVGQ